MAGARVGVNVDDFRLPPKEGIQRAARMGFGTIELRTVDGDLDPGRLSESGRRHLARFVRDLGLGMAALDTDFGPKGLSDPALVDAAVHKIGQALELARGVGAPVVVGSVGRLDDTEPERRDQVLAALRAVGEQADRTGSIYAVTTALTSPDALHRLLAEVGCPSIWVCADPGAMVMAGYDPIAATEALADQVILSHARDGLAGASDRGGREMPLGQGDVNLGRYLATLSAAGYAGPQILRRCDSQRPVDDLAAAKELLESQMG